MSNRSSDRRSVGKSEMTSRRIKLSSEPLYSFDVFDTLITRATSTPEGVFLEVQERAIRMYPGVGWIESFAERRIEAEANARRDVDYEDVSFSEIYSALKQRVPDASTLESLQQLELKIELEHSRPIVKNLEKVERLLDEQQRCVLISDMYLPEDFILQLLKKHSPKIALHCPLYVSGEHRMTKGSGKLFKHVLSEQGVSASQMKHLGDNLTSDVDVPNSMGINAQWYSESNLSSIESIGQEVLDVRWQRVSGGGRLARMEGKSLPYRLGLGVAGPIFGSFVHWVLSVSKRRHTRKLFFLSRDGFLLERMARFLAPSINPELETVYLYGSRAAWKRPNFAGKIEQNLDWLLKSFKKNSVKEICHRLGINVEKFVSLVPLGVESDATLSGGQLDKVRDSLLQNETLRVTIDENSRDQETLFREYLSESGVLANDDVTLVDVGWGGTMQDALREFFDSLDAKAKIHGLYFGCTDSRAKIDSAGNTSQSFERTFASRNQFVHFAIYFESLATALDGSVSGYERTNSGVTPILDDQHLALQDWGYDELVQGAMEFVSQHADMLDDHAYWIQYANRYIDFMEKGLVDAEMAEGFGSYPFTPDTHSDGLRQLAPRVGLTTAIRYALSTPQARAEITHWANASAARSSWLAALFLGQTSVRFLRYLIKPWFLHELLPNSIRRAIIGMLPKRVVDWLIRRIYGT